MNNKLVCPFCGEKLVRYWGMESPAIYCCDNQKCSRGGIATESAWKALIQAKQDLEIATKAMNQVMSMGAKNNICYHLKAKTVKSILGKALEQIEHKE